MLLLYPGELYRLLGASSFLEPSVYTLFFIKFLYSFISFTYKLRVRVHIHTSYMSWPSQLFIIHVDNKSIEGRDM
jgi:hypothetical protein